MRPPSDLNREQDEELDVLHSTVKPLDLVVTTTTGVSIVLGDEDFDNLPRPPPVPANPEREQIVLHFHSYTSVFRENSSRYSITEW